MAFMAVRACIVAAHQEAAFPIGVAPHRLIYFREDCSQENNRG
jgi:hypothetical protein